MVQWVSVYSSIISKVGYDASNKLMFVCFKHSHGEHPYCGISAEMFDSFINASSAGEFYKEHIEDQYDCR